MIFLNKNKYLNIYFYIFIISGKWWNALVEYVNPSPAAAPAPPNNLELLMQQVKLLRDTKQLLEVKPPCAASVQTSQPRELNEGTGVPGEGGH
jgi:hypothetical protein